MTLCLSRRHLIKTQIYDKDDAKSVLCCNYICQSDSYSCNCQHSKYLSVHSVMCSTLRCVEVSSLAVFKNTVSLAVNTALCDSVS